MASGHVPRATTAPRSSGRVHTSSNHRIGSVIKYPSSNRVAINVNGTKYEIGKLNLLPSPIRYCKLLKSA